ncbi:MAG: DNA polymerase III subunit delta [Coriobacteriales bacterium]|jgi:DNA polymerase-3 subunit delta|nr:DNA polymerase III subunit delta [Coriobacteriales bacterium]
MAEATQTGTPLLPVYLFNGDDELKQETLRKRLIQRVFGVGHGVSATTGTSGDRTDSTDANDNTDDGGLEDLNLQVFRPDQIRDAEHLLDTLNTLPFMADHRLLIIKEADKLPKALSECIIEYLKAPNPSTILALSAHKLAVNTRLYKAIAAIQNGKTIVNAASLKASQIPELTRRIASSLGIALTVDAAAELVDRIGTSTVTISTELKKLSAWAQAQGIQQITMEMIADQVIRVTESKPWDLADALSLRRPEACLQHLSRLQASTPQSLFTYCLGRLREMLSIKSLERRGGMSSQRIAATLGRQDWQLRSAFSGSRLYSQGELINALIEAPSIEARMKSGADAKQLLTLWLMTLCKG